MYIEFMEITEYLTETSENICSKNTDKNIRFILVLKFFWFFENNNR